MFSHFLLFLFLASSLFANIELESLYLVKSKQIKLSSITKNLEDDTIIYTIDRTKHSKKVKTKTVLRLLQSKGYKTTAAKHPYVNFVQKSPIDTKKIEQFVREYYKKHYPTMQINKILVTPRFFTKTLPENYSLSMQKKSFLRHHAIVILKSYKGKEIFFDTFVTASLKILTTKKAMKRNEELSFFNTQTKTVHFDKFQALPLMQLQKGSLQAKHALRKEQLISIRDIRSLFLVRKGSNVNVSLYNSNMSISFSAKAIQNGCYGDIIQVINHQGKKIKVIVTGKYQAEVR